MASSTKIVEGKFRGFIQDCFAAPQAFKIMNKRSLLHLDAADLTDVGLRRQRNEDIAKIVIPPADSPQQAYGALLVVADGMGGLGGGETASRSAIDEIVRRYYADLSEPGETLERLHTALEAANRFVRDQASRIGFRRIGSTAAGLVLTPSGMALSFSIGDSRVYRLRKGFIEQLTRDQSVMARQLANGSITAAQARKIRNSNVTAFLGQPTPIQPEFRQEQTHPGDVFIICSDGLWSVVEPEEMRDQVSNTSAPEATYKLVQLALERGAPDNVTVIVARVEPRPLWKNPRFAAVFLLLIAIFIAALLLAH